MNTFSPQEFCNTSCFAAGGQIKHTFLVNGVHFHVYAGEEEGDSERMRGEVRRRPGRESRGDRKRERRGRREEERE